VLETIIEIESDIRSLFLLRLRKLLVDINFNWMAILGLYDVLVVIEKPLTSL